MMQNIQYFAMMSSPFVEHVQNDKSANRIKINAYSWYAFKLGTSHYKFES